MGFPAEGLESFYRNNRADAKRFLEHRHGKNFWVFNFCPIRENSYSASFFDGRVSRYPFPDHQCVVSAAYMCMLTPAQVRRRWRSCRLPPARWHSG
jgi:hypothetical protein